MNGVLKKRRVRKSVITITHEGGKLNVRAAFFPSCKTTGQVPPDVAAAIHGVGAIARWAKGIS